ncbi:MAG: chemotaxis-specific protein-glutamate methyltransferase CheB [Gemmataceae bacterium]|nr:chemotaxis-specific protein-glutamate methyltransferase CheB [Gemmataceae bacterium]
MRVAVVNDLALAREVLRRVVVSVPGYEVAWAAADGAEAVRRAAADRPDVVLMDLVMPVMDGVAATRAIMRATPCPVLVVTSTIDGHFDRVYEAMGAGAVDAVETPTLGPGGVTNAGPLVERLRKLGAAMRGETGTALHPALPADPRPAGHLPPVVAIAASTGGPDALAAVLGAFPADLPAAVLVVQHIAAAYAPGLAVRLAAGGRLPVRVAREGDRPTAGVALLAATDDHLALGPAGLLRYTPEPRTAPYRPSADVLFTSLSAHGPRRGVGVILTGMGADGAAGLLALRRAGWHTVAQDGRTCVVYGMPKAAAELGAAAEVLPLDRIGPAVALRIRTLAAS